MVFETDPAILLEAASLLFVASGSSDRVLEEAYYLGFFFFDAASARHFSISILGYSSSSS